MLSREIGHSRVPAPPHMITGIIGCFEPPVVVIAFATDFLAQERQHSMLATT